ncbi:MAG: site-specific integrase [Lachnospiraceae bacterium]|nr:site-specific integrase [Lachnospiraceae bacterium]
MNDTTTKNQEQVQSRKRFLEERDPVLPPQSHPRADTAPSHCRTVEELCLDWLRDRLTAVKKSTFSTYTYCVNAHILPLLGHLPLPELSEDTILSFIRGIQEKELADTTAHAVLMVFKFVVRHGVRLGVVQDGLAACCRFTFRRPESRILAVQDSVPMKEYLLRKRSIFAVSILLCRGTGIRVGELCGLKWGDFDFKTGTFHIKRTVSRIPNPDTSPGQPKTILYIRTPKSHTSSREIPIPEFLIIPLRRMRKADDLYVLTGKDTCTEPRNVQKRFKTILKRCEMEDCNFHAMRHGFATACLEKGIDCKTVSSILGHSSIRTTMDFYVHTSMRQKTDCINGID